jgi:DNA repair protein RadC
VRLVPSGLRAIPPELSEEVIMVVREFTAAEYRVVTRAMGILENVLREPGVCMTNAKQVREYLQLRLGAHEVFMVLFLDSRHGLIEAREMFRGTLTQTAVYPREVVKAALLLDSAAVIVAHNHPSGVAEASVADRVLTDALKTALGCVDVPVLDHIIVAGVKTLSFAEQGWL